MDKLRLVVSLPNQNHYQQAQAQSAVRSGAELGGEVTILDADNDSVNQSQQLLEILQSRSEPLPDAILVEPLTSTGLVKVAEAAVAAGVAWVVLNSQVDYVELLRAKAKAPIFVVTRDHNQIGRIQGLQFAALLPQGGTALYIQGPATSAAAAQRTAGVEATRPSNINIRPLRSQWTEESAREAVSAWLRLSTSRPDSINIVGCQYDGIARGARQAFQDVPDTQDRDRWLAIPFTGVDGLPDQGQRWVSTGELAATVVTPITTEIAIEMLVRALKGESKPPAVTFLELRSLPPTEELAEIGRKLSTRSRA